MSNSNFFIHNLADVSEEAKVGLGTKIWGWTQVLPGAQIGSECIIGTHVTIDTGVVVGDRCKIQAGARIFHGSVLEEGVFIGPNVVLTNDKHPRAINDDGTIKNNCDWTESGVRICKGAAIGAMSVICPGVTIGEFATIGAGSVVTKDVSPNTTVFGNPAREYKNNK